MAKFGMREERAPSPLSVIQHCRITTEKIPSQSIPTLRKNSRSSLCVRIYARAGTLKKKARQRRVAVAVDGGRTRYLQKIVRTMSEGASAWRARPSRSRRPTCPDPVVRHAQSSRHRKQLSVRTSFENGDDVSSLYTECSNRA